MICLVFVSYFFLSKVSHFSWLQSKTRLCVSKPRIKTLQTCIYNWSILQRTPESLNTSCPSFNSDGSVSSSQILAARAAHKQPSGRKACIVSTAPGLAWPAWGSGLWVRSNLWVRAAPSWKTILFERESIPHLCWKPGGFLIKGMAHMSFQTCRTLFLYKLDALILLLFMNHLYINKFINIFNRFLFLYFYFIFCHVYSFYFIFLFIFIFYFSFSHCSALIYTYYISFSFI